MSDITLDIHGRSYDVVCKSGDEDKVRDLGKEIETRLDIMDISLEKVSPARGMLMLCLVLLDEIKEMQATAGSGSAEGGAADQAAHESIANSLEALKTIVSDLEKL